MDVIHLAAECYPAAKAGGLGDVVGALPKYLNQIGTSTGVVIPMYRLKWFFSQEYYQVFSGTVRLHNDYYPFTVQEVTSAQLGYSLFAIDIPGKFDRAGIYADPGGYGYGDDVERWLCFQQAALIWMRQWEEKPKIIHCHDHHTGLVPFFVKHCPEYKALAHIPTVFTIHNGVYHGAFSWEKMYLLPFFDSQAKGMLDWMSTIHPLAAAIKCSWHFTTVSPGYMDELKYNSNGMEWLIQHEQHKASGIINGIDAQVWDPRTDPLLYSRLEGDDVEGFKKKNKDILAHRFHINTELPLITFIGRLVSEKGADMIPDLIRKFLYSGQQAFFVILGTGDPRLQESLAQMSNEFYHFVDTALEYNETLSHQLYAGSDFLLMPSRVEPCGLNQMYSMRYGTVPIVRSVGGLRNTVIDIGEPDGTGRGIRFDNFSVDDAFIATFRAVELYKNPTVLAKIRRRIMDIDFSWENSAQHYNAIYKHLQ